MGKRSKSKGRRGARHASQRARSQSSKHHSRPRSLPLAWLVVLVTVVVYANAVPGEFVFDDQIIQRDSRIQGETSLWTVFTTDYWGDYRLGSSRNLYRPLTIASYRLNHALFGENSATFHVSNIGLHALTCILLACFVQALLRDRTLAAVSALLFATHPIHTEAVTGIVGRAELLAALFLLIALNLHVRDYVVLGWGRGRWLSLGLVAFLCALLSKETAIVAPGLILLVDYIRARSAPDCMPWRAGLGRKAGVLGLYLGVVVAYLVLRYAVLGHLLEAPGPRPGYLLVGEPLVTRILTGLHILVIYLKLLLFPLTLSADYSYRQVPLVTGLGSWANTTGVLLGLLATAGLCAVGLLSLRKRAWPLVLALGFFALTYVIPSNIIVPIGTLLGERLMYLPSMGFCVGVAWLGVQLAGRYAALPPPPRLRQLPRALLGAVLVLYGARTAVRNVDWWSNERLFAATTRASPNCHAAHFNYAAVLMKGRNDPERTQLGLQHLERAYTIRRDHYPSLVNLALAHLRLGQSQQAVRFAREGLEQRPDSKQLKRILRQAERKLKQR